MIILTKQIFKEIFSYTSYLNIVNEGYRKII